MSMDQDKLLDILDKRYSTDNKGDYFHVTTSLTAGIVVDTDDPLQQGRLRIFCPSHGDDPSKILQLPWAVYISPFGGTIANPAYERNGDTTDGAVSYGFWGIPEVGANIIVGCIDGDLRRRFWLGTMYDQQETHTLGNGRYNWSSGGVADGPLSSAGKPIQPAYDNAKTSFKGENNSPEWQARMAEYTIAAVDKSLNQPPTPDKSSYLDQMHPEIAAAQQFGFNQDTVGENGYGWSGFGGLSFKSSKVIALTSPGFASITLDDRMFNSRTKLRSSTGHMVLLDDTNERIYVKTNTGNAWMEMDSAGNVDVYSSRRISLNSDLDVNINAGGSVRIQGKEGVYIYAGTDNGLTKLTDAPNVGEVRIHSQNDMNLLSKNLRLLTFEDSIFEIGKDFSTSVGGSLFTQVESGINFISNGGNFDITITGDYNSTVTGDTHELTIGTANYYSNSNFNIHSYNGSVDIISQKDIDITTLTGNTTVSTVLGNTLINSTGTLDLTATGVISIVSSASVVIVPPAELSFSSAELMELHHVLPQSTLLDISPMIFGDGTGIEVNSSVISGLPPIPSGSYPIPEQPSSPTLSQVEQAPWTNRVPAHEPWPRTLMGDTPSANSPNNESGFNTSHNPQFVDDGGNASKSINRVEGTEVIKRGQFWRR